ncbi:MAG: DsbA family protein [Candidatus Binatia bacterium]
MAAGRRGRRAAAGERAPRCTGARRRGEDAPLWLDSRRAHAVSLSLGAGAKEAAWRERVWSAAFEEGRDIGTPEELDSLGADLSLDVRGLGTEPMLRRLVAETAAAAEAGVTAVPSFVLGDFPFAGIQAPATMLDLFTRYVARQRSGGSER